MDTYTVRVNYNGQTATLKFYPPRPYQEEAVDNWIRAGKFGAVQLPTGAGKTFVALYAWERLGFPKMVIVVPTNALKQSHIHELVKLGLPEEWITTDPRKKDGLVAIVTYQLLTMNPRLFDEMVRRGYRFWVFDESHHVSAEKFFDNVFSKIHAEGRDAGVDILGLSATPHGSGYYVEKIKRYFPIVYKKTVEDLKPYLAPIYLYLVATPLSPEAQAQYEEASAQLKKLYEYMFRHYGTANMAVLGKHMDDPAVRKFFQLFNLKKTLLNFVRNKARATAKILQAHPDEKAMIFADRQDFLIRLMKDLKDEYGIKGFPFVGKIIKNKKMEKEVLDAFREGRIRVLGLVKKGEEGVNFPDVSIGIITSTSKNDRTLIQRIGRVIRRKPGKIARIYYLYAPGTDEEEIARKLATLLKPDKVFWIKMGDIGKVDEGEPPEVEEIEEKPAEVPEKERILRTIRASREALLRVKQKAEETLARVRRRGGLDFFMTQEGKEYAKALAKKKWADKMLKAVSLIETYLNGGMSDKELRKELAKLGVTEKEIKTIAGEYADRIPKPVDLTKITGWVRNERAKG